MSSDYQLEDTVFLPFTTRAFATGIPTVLAGTPAIDIYEDATATPIITGETLVVSLNSVVGFNMITVTATAATGFGAGQSYTAIIQAGTVGGVSVVGEVVAHFTLDMSAAAKDLANGTDGLGAIKADTAATLTDTGEIGTAGVGLTDLGGMSAGMKAEVNVEVDGALDTAIPELGVAAPTATPTIRTGLMLMYMALRNKLVTQTSGTDALELYDDAGTKIAIKLLTDDGSDYTEAEMTTGA